MDQSSASLLGEAKTLLVATDGSRFSEGAIQEAIFFGQACRAKVIVLHVVPTQAESIGAANFALRQGREALTPHLNRIRESAQEKGTELEVVVIGSSKPEKAIIEQARLRHADVVLMGRHGKAGRLSRLVGKMTTKVIALGFPRVLVAPKECTLSGTHVLLAVNGSDNSRQAAREALSLRTSCPTLRRMTVLSVAKREANRASAQALVDAICALAAGDESPVPCDPLVTLGDPAEQIVMAARERDADMIVIGGPGKSGLAKMLKGHVTEHVIGYAPCAVLVVSA